MNIREAIVKRRSIRGFLPKEVPREKIVQILDVARHAPSGANTQPWQVAVLTGKSKTKLATRLEDEFKAGKYGQKDYNYYPEKWLSPYKGRRTACGKQLYSALNIERQDKEKRLRQWAANYRAFDAPVMLLFFIDSSLEKGSFIDYGMFLQSIMLAAMGEGLATCPQAALAEYPHIVRQLLNYPEKYLLLCGIALGYEDKSAAVNSYRTPREEVDVFTRFFD